MAPHIINWRSDIDDLLIKSVYRHITVVENPAFGPSSKTRIAAWDAIVRSVNSLSRNTPEHYVTKNMLQRRWSTLKRKAQQEKGRTSLALGTPLWKRKPRNKNGNLRSQKLTASNKKIISTSPQSEAAGLNSYGESVDNGNVSRPSLRDSDSRYNLRSATFPALTEISSLTKQQPMFSVSPGLSSGQPEVGDFGPSATTAVQSTSTAVPVGQVQTPTDIFHPSNFHEIEAARISVMSPNSINSTTRSFLLGERYRPTALAPATASASAPIASAPAFASAPASAPASALASSASAPAPQLTETPSHRAEDAQLQAQHLQICLVMEKKLHDAKVQKERLLMKWAEELHAAQTHMNASTFEKNVALNRELQQQNQELHLAKIRTEEMSCTLQSQLHDVRLEGAILEREAAQIKKRIMEMKLKKVELELRKLEEANN